jgi:CubicO group peptidase (beta-lactamase class C family)
MRSRIQAYVDWIINNDLTEYSGLMVGIDTPDCGKSVHTTGLADRDQEITMRPDHILPVASISKTFLGATVLQLVEEGQLSLEDKLSNWRTDIPNADIITVRQLLNNTSGIYPYMTGDFLTPCDEMFHNDPDLVWTPEDMLDCIDGEQPRFEPGTDWEYSNTNYVLLGLIVEAVTGNELHVEIRNRILDPLGLDHTFSLGEEEVIGDLARSYYYFSYLQSWTDITDNYNISFYWATGNLGSNAEDLLTWIRNLLTGSVLEESSLVEMTNCYDLGDQTWIQDDYVESGYGLGIYCGSHDDAGDWLGHTGGYETAVAILWHSLAWDTSVVIQSNRGMHNRRPRAWPFNIWSEVINILGEYR